MIGVRSAVWEHLLPWREVKGAGCLDIWLSGAKGNTAPPVSSVLDIRNVRSSSCRPKLLGSLSLVSASLAVWFITGRLCIFPVQTFICKWVFLLCIGNNVIIASLNHKSFSSCSFTKTVHSWQHQSVLYDSHFSDNSPPVQFTVTDLFFNVPIQSGADWSYSLILHFTFYSSRPVRIIVAADHILVLELWNDFHLIYFRIFNYVTNVWYLFFLQPGYSSFS